MIIETPQELISLWEQILTGTYEASPSTPAATSMPSESFDDAMAAAGVSEAPAPEEITPTPETPPDESDSASGVTKSQILATGTAFLGAAVSLWQSLDEETQEAMRAHAQIMASQAATRAKAYWDPLPSEQQAQVRTDAQQKAHKARARWQALPA